MTCQGLVIVRCRVEHKKNGQHTVWLEMDTLIVYFSVDAICSKLSVYALTVLQ